jgi:type II secretory pathway component GspD/PulD (secretin)
MHRLKFIAAIGLLALATGPSFASRDAPLDTPIISCGNGVPGGMSCIPSKKDEKEARTAYARGLRLEEHKRYDQAFLEFDQASRLVSEDTKFFAAREVAKSQLVFQHTERGDALLADGHREPAAAEFRSALKLDPDNDYLQGRLAEALRSSAGSVPSPLVAESSEIHLQPRPEVATFHYTGDVRGLFTELASAYGVTAEFDDSVLPMTVRFYVDDVDFFTALNLASRVSKTMWSPLDTHQLLIAKNTPENHKQFDRMSLAKFAVPGAGAQQETNDLVNALKSICEFQKVNSGQTGILEVRAPQAMLQACTTLMQQLSSEPPQVSLTIEIYQISHNLTRNIGLHIPDTFNLYNIPVAALAALGGQSIQSLVNQLIASGGINQAGTSGLSGLLAQLQGQQNSIFSQPLATFGGGLTFSGLSLDQLSAALSVNESWSRAVSRATLRAGQGKEATFHVGERYPILNASYAPIFNSPQISQVLGNQSYVPPFPSVSYEDLGLNLKATTVIHGDTDISLKLELQVRSLTGQSANGVPIISNQEYQGSIRLRDGEPAVVAGQISSSDIRSMTGIPGLGVIPGLNQAMVSNSLTTENDELLVVITPHIVANHDRKANAIWITQN